MLTKNLTGRIILKTLRKSKNLTIVELAEKMGVPKEYLAKLETGELNPTSEQLETIKDFVEGKL